MDKLLAWYKGLTTKQIIFGGLRLALAVAVFVIVRGFVATWTLTTLPGIAITQSAAQDEDETTQATPTPQVTAPESQLPDPWDGASRVNILVLGLDYRDWEAGDEAPRSDTMLVVTIDPTTPSAGMLSIPRDMWVNIPGFGYGKINTAYALGEAYKLPGGGPALAAKTVSEFLGIPIHYYAQVDFNAFVRFIDEIDGVPVTPTQDLSIDPIGYNYDVKLEAGETYTLPGDLALAYVRTRDSENGDVDRAHRQQEVILAIIKRILSYDMAPKLVAKAPALYQELSAGIQTNMSLDDAIRLGLLVLNIPEENIKTGVIDFSMVTLGTSPDGLYIFKPIPDKIRELRDEIFTNTAARRPLATGNEEELALAEEALLRAYNGTYVPGLAGATTEYLASFGFRTAEASNADQLYSRTVLIDRSGNPHTLRYLMQIFNIQSNAQIRLEYTPDAGEDISIMLGDDWGYSNPMP